MPLGGSAAFWAACALSLHHSLCGAVAFAPHAVVRYVEAPLADVLNVAASGHDVTEPLEDSVKSGAARVRRALLVCTAIRHRKSVMIGGSACSV